MERNCCQAGNDDSGTGNTTGQSYSTSSPQNELRVDTTPVSYPPKILKTPGGPSEYHMTQINSYAMTGNAKSFREGATAYRKVRDMAKRHRDDFIEQANRGARQLPADSPSTTLTNSRTSLSVLYEGQSDTSADELTAEELTIKRTRDVHQPSSRQDSSTSRYATTSRVYVAAHSSPRSRHTYDNSVTARRATTSTGSVAAPYNARYRYAADESVGEPWRRAKSSQKPLGGRHASDRRG